MNTVVQTTNPNIPFNTITFEEPVHVPEESPFDAALSAARKALKEKNAHRKAIALDMLRTKFNLTGQEIAGTLGISPQQCSLYLAISDFPPEVRIEFKPGGALIPNDANTLRPLRNDTPKLLSVANDIIKRRTGREILATPNLFESANDESTVASGNSLLPNGVLTERPHGKSKVVGSHKLIVRGKCVFEEVEITVKGYKRLSDADKSAILMEELNA